MNDYTTVDFIKSNLRDEVILRQIQELLEGCKDTYDQNIVIDLTSRNTTNDF